MQALIYLQLLIKGEVEENIFHHVIAFPSQSSRPAPFSLRNDYFI